MREPVVRAVKKMQREFFPPVIRNRPVSSGLWMSPQAVEVGVEAVHPAVRVIAAVAGQLKNRILAPLLVAGQPSLPLYPQPD